MAVDLSVSYRAPATARATGGTRKKRLSRMQAIDLVLCQQALERAILVGEFGEVLGCWPYLDRERMPHSALDRIDKYGDLPAKPTIVNRP